MFILLVVAAKILSGTNSTKGCNGPDSFCSKAASTFSFAFPSYVAIKSFLVLSVIEFPGAIVLTKINPIITAKTVVNK